MDYKVLDIQMKLFDNNSGAYFSNDAAHRFLLWRIWEVNKPRVMFIGLNPSTANHITNDPTINTISAVSKNAGYGGFYMVNLFTLISSKPDILNENVCEWNNCKEIILSTSTKCNDVVFAWGNFKIAKHRALLTIPLFPNAKAVGVNKNGSPRHPLFMKYNSPLISFTND